MKRLLASTEYPPSSQVLNEIRAWAEQNRVRKLSQFDRYGVYLEKHSIQDIVNSYIRYFNKNVSYCGDGFATDWDPDDWMTIKYKDGRVREINPEVDDGTKKISVDNIDSIIIDGGWGTAFAGPNIVFEDYTTYDDILDIRPVFYNR